MIASNHLSYMDILILSSVAPMLYISSVEMRGTPFVGLIADLGGTLFVERRNRDNIDAEINEISQALQHGFNVVLFAEATSSDGSSVLPFKRSMLTAATQTGASLLPLTINYRKLDGEPVTAANRDRLCWYGDMTFLPHFREVLANENAVVDLTFHAPFPLAKDADTKPIAQHLHDLISEAYAPLK